MRPAPFFLVWSPSGDHPPRHQHRDRETAEREANRLSDAHPGREFYVLEPRYQVVSQKRLTERFLTDDGIPF